MADDKNKLVHVDFSKYPELLEALDQMVNDDDLDRSKFIRKLVKQEKARREQPRTSLPFPPTNIRKRNTTNREVAVAV